MIGIQRDGTVFHLQAGGSSYVMRVFSERYLVHAYWGGRLESVETDQMLTLGARPYTISEPVDPVLADAFHRQWRSPPESLSDPGQALSAAVVSPERLPLEYPVAGTGDLREPALRIRYADGSTVGRPEYRGYEIIEGAAGPAGLPYVTDTPTEVRTLRIDMEDSAAGLNVELYYLPLPDLPVVLRWVRIVNGSDAPTEINQAASASLDIPGEDADLVTLNGAWARERHFYRRPVAPGIQQVESRGGASGHQHAPFIALVDRDTTEWAGRTYAMSLLYSGNHRHLAERDQHGATRLQSGINPGGFSFSLMPGESFDTPAAALAWSDSGLSGITDAYHPFVRRYLIPERWRDRDRPIVVNTWEARYFDVDADSVVALAQQGREIGAEVLVLDDGWFVNRRDDTRALGDWIPDAAKFPDGLAATAQQVRDTGMGFGLWVEPEMVNPESELYRRHPEWVLGAPGRPSVFARNQLVLDLSQQAVVDHLLDVFSGIFSSAPIVYVKWDMNRYIVETANPETPHRYMLGLYRLWSVLADRFPHILFEGCAGGGGRFDFGSLAYMPQFWTSDQTDAAERWSIQYGTSLLFPPETMGAHVSAVPNHQVGRTTPAHTRGLTALGFNFGFELDFSKESAEDRAVYTRLSELYKQHRSLFRTGRFLRLLPGPFLSADRPPDYAWAVVSEDKNDAMVFYFQFMAQPNDDGRWLRLRGLDEGAAYRDIERDVRFDSAFLQNRGLWLPPAVGDFRSAYWILEKVS